MKILLLNPPFTEYGGLEGHGGKAAPLNLAYLAAFLRAKRPQDKISILDCEGLELSYNDIAIELKSIQPDIVGITAPTPAYVQVKEVSKIIKEISKDIKVILGGPHPTAFPLETVKEEFVDFSVYGEGELTLLDLVNAIDKKMDFSSVKGIAFKDIYGDAHLTELRPLIQDLDSIPFPARELLPLEIYFPPPTKRVSNKKSGNMITSRGCPYQCTYCMARIIWNKKVRYRSVKNVVDEIEECVKNFGIGEFNFHDELFTLKKERTIEICREIRRRKLDIAWVCMVRVDYVWEDVLREMKLAGCKKIMFGFESGSQEILDLMKKNVKVEQAYEAVKLVKRCGIKTAGNFMFGNIGETEETIRKSINLAKRLNTDTVAFFIASPYPGTEFYNIAKESGYFRQGLDWKDFTLVSDNARPPLDLPGLSSERIAYWQKKAYKEYYFRMDYIFQKLFGIRSIIDVNNLFYGVRLLFKLQK
ncbi:MAG: radical SAM protein [Candidatus Omnitrophota bacterium]